MKTSPDPWVDGAECLGVVMLGAFGTEWQRQYRSLCSHPYLFPLSGSSQSAATLVDVSVRAVSNPFCSLTPYPASFSLWSPSPDPRPPASLLFWNMLLCLEVPCVSSPGLESWEARALWTSSLLGDEHGE